MIQNPEKRQLMQDRYALEDRARALIRQIAGELGEDVREEIRYLSAKAEVFFNGIEDLIYLDPSERSPEDVQRRSLRRQTDELFLARAELDRKLRDTRRQALEVEEEVRVDRAKREVGELQVEIARLDPAGS